MDISTNTLTLAMHALVIEIENIKAAVAGSGNEASADDERQRVLDLQAALSELGTIYQERQVQDPRLAAAVDWLPADR